MVAVTVVVQYGEGLDTFGPVVVEQVDIQVMVVMVVAQLGYMRLEQVTVAEVVEDH
jgi:hypothetical protein